MALPLTVSERGEGWLDALVALLAEHRASEVVVGLPVSLRGTEGAAAARARELAAEVGTRLGVPVHLVDERLSTVAAGPGPAEGRAPGRPREALVGPAAAARDPPGHLHRGAVGRRG